MGPVEVIDRGHDAVEPRVRVRVRARLRVRLRLRITVRVRVRVRVTVGVRVGVGVGLGLGLPRYWRVARGSHRWSSCPRPAASTEGWS